MEVLEPSEDHHVLDWNLLCFCTDKMIDLLKNVEKNFFFMSPNFKKGQSWATMFEKVTKPPKLHSKLEKIFLVEKIS